MASPFSSVLDTEHLTGSVKMVRFVERRAADLSEETGQRASSRLRARRGTPTLSSQGSGRALRLFFLGSLSFPFSAVVGVGNFAGAATGKRRPSPARRCRRGVTMDVGRRSEDASRLSGRRVHLGRRGAGVKGQGTRHDFRCSRVWRTTELSDFPLPVVPCVRWCPTAVSEDLQDQEDPGQEAEAEQAHSPVDPHAYRQHHPVSTRRVARRPHAVARRANRGPLLVW